MSTIAASTALDLPALNKQFETADAAQIVAWAVEQFGDDLVMSSSFGAESALLLHMAHTLKPDIRVIFVDTGYLFPETHAFMEELRKRFNLNIWNYRTRNDPIAYLRRAGEENPDWRKDKDSCCAANKNEPFDRAIRELAPRAWLRGVRRDQTEVRAKMDFVEWVDERNCYAVSPILNFDRRAIHAYLKRYDLPYHPLFLMGYESVGCNPHRCTRPVVPGEDPRRTLGRQR